MSKIAQPSHGGAKSDQRKIYTDWANNRLRKSGLSDSLVTDLQKDIPDGVLLPKIIQAVIQEKVPAVVEISDDNERRQNIEACVLFLQRKGVNCAGFTSKDISEGSMRSILQLFFNLSQFKPKSSEGDHPPSRISRPISPGLRLIHSVHSTGSLNAHSSNHQPHSNPQSGSQVHSSTHLSTTNHVSSKPSSSPNSPVLSPTTNPLSSLSSSTPGNTSTAPVSNIKSHPSQRRHAGSTIPTGLDPLGQHRRPYRPMNINGSTPTLVNETSGNDENSESTSSDKTSSSPVTCTSPVTVMPSVKPTNEGSIPPPSGIQAPKRIGLKPPGSQSNLKMPASRNLSLSSGISKPGVSRNEEGLKLPNEVPKIDNVKSSDENISSQDDTSEKDSSSKLKHPGSNRPPRSLSFGKERSGLIRPSGHLQHPSEQRGNLTKLNTKEEIKELPINKEKSPETNSSENHEDESSHTKVPSGIPGTRSGIQPPGNQGFGFPRGDRKRSSGRYHKVQLGSGLQHPQEPRVLNPPSKSLSMPDEPKNNDSSLPKKMEEKDIEPEKSSKDPSVSKTSKLQELTQLPQVSKIKAPGTTAFRRSSDSVNDTSKSQLEGSDEKPKSKLGDLKTNSKLALLTRKPQQIKPDNTSTTSNAAPTSVNTTSSVTPSIPSDPEPKNIPESKSVDPVPQVKGSPSRARNLPPLNIGNIGTTPTKTNDSVSSNGSIGSLTSSNNSQSDSSIVDLQTPSPSSGRKYVRRTSPEGMSVDETASPRDCHKLSDLSHDSELDKTEQELPPAVVKDTDKTKDVTAKENISRVETPPTAISNNLKIKRAQSLSPKTSRRILPLQPSNVTHVISTGSQEKVGKHVKPVRSSLRIPRQPGGNKRVDKRVTISPHSSVDSFSSSDTSLTQNNEIHNVNRLTNQTERPKSLEVESHNFSSANYPGDLHPHVVSNLVRHGSTQSTRSERLDYSEVVSFLEPGLQDSSEDRHGSSTPELLETYETQLTSLKKDLESKSKMLTMYETSMADLSSKVHSLKRTLEEKDQAIKHLTEDRHRWNEFPFDQHSLAPSRLATSDIGTLSDGAVSDGTNEFDKEENTTKKKKKPWKVFSRRNKRKKEQDMNELEVSSIAGGKSLKRGVRGKPSDLISISEYSNVEGKDIDNKSYFDIRSEFGYVTSNILEDSLTIYDEEGDDSDKVMVILLADDILASREEKLETVMLGSICVPPKTSWVTMDTKICDIFKHHIESIDPEGCLALNDESILHYHVSDVCRSIGNALLPPVTPHQALSENQEITIALKGVAQESCDALAYKFLVSVDVFHSYIAMLLETQWIVVMGTKGTCKTSLAEGLASYLELLVKEQEMAPDEEIGLLNMDEDNPVITRLAIASSPGSMGDGLEVAMKFIKQELPHQMNRHSRTPILLFDNVYDCQALEHLMSTAGRLPKRPYIISTLCAGGTTCGVPLHQLMFRHNIRLVTCSPQTEPIYGILSRTLRKNLYRLKADPNRDIDPEVEILVNWLPLLLDHLNFFISKFHSNNVALGPRVFMNCPLEYASVEAEVWFINLWNHFIIPYLMGTIMAGIETYTADPHLEWIDVREWVLDMYPWQQSHSIHKLKTLNPDDVGWNHAVRPQQSRLMYIKDDDTQSVLRMKQNTEMAI